jgi:hypothetical protein
MLKSYLEEPDAPPMTFAKSSAIINPSKSSSISKNALLTLTQLLESFSLSTCSIYLIWLVISLFLVVEFSEEPPIDLLS